MKIKIVVRDAEEGGFWAEVPAAPPKATPWTSSCEICMKRLKVVCLATADEMNRWTCHVVRELPQDQGRMDH